jgi:hypothetical protein
MKAGDTLILGFLGGWDHWNDENRFIRKLVLRLRETSGFAAESIENHHRYLGLELIRKALDRNGNGSLEPEEAASARIILVGQSMGGAAVVKLARELETLAIPVLFTVQVDSWGFDDDIIPANVRAAVNFYQREPLTWRGETAIQPADPSRTQILGNIRRDYPRGNPANPRPESWRRRVFGGGHARMEADPALWTEVERLIRSAAAGENPQIAPTAVASAPVTH